MLRVTEQRLLHYTTMTLCVDMTTSVTWLRPCEIARRQCSLDRWGFPFPHGTVQPLSYQHWPLQHERVNGYSTIPCVYRRGIPVPIHAMVHSEDESRTQHSFTMYVQHCTVMCIVLYHVQCLPTGTFPQYQVPFKPLQRPDWLTAR